MDFWLFAPFLLWAVYAIHAFEEVHTLPKFMAKNYKTLAKKYPRTMKRIGNPSKKSFAAATILLGLMVILATGLPYFMFNTNSSAVGFFVFYVFALAGIWFAQTANFLMHIFQSIVIRKYTPGLISAILFLPVGVIMLGNLRFNNLLLNAVAVLVAVGLSLLLLNLLHKFFMPWFDKKFGKVKEEM